MSSKEVLALGGLAAALVGGFFLLRGSGVKSLSVPDFSFGGGSAPVGVVPKAEHKKEVRSSQDSASPVPVVITLEAPQFPTIEKEEKTRVEKQAVLPVGHNSGVSVLTTGRSPDDSPIQEIQAAHTKKETVVYKSVKPVVDVDSGEVTGFHDYNLKMSIPNTLPDNNLKKRQVLINPLFVGTPRIFSKDAEIGGVV